MLWESVGRLTKLKCISEKYYQILFILQFFVFIDVWGFDKKAVDVLKNMKPTDEFLNQRYAILLDSVGCVPEADQEVRTNTGIIGSGPISFDIKLIYS